ncbi:uncharacterized protein FYW61_011491 isoform 2-T2 [Anableps anableps]
MSSVQHLREFIRERLTAAAEEIFTEVEKTIVRDEEDIRLLETCWKPQMKLTRIELPKKHVWKEEEVLSDQRQPEPPQFKEQPQDGLSESDYLQYEEDQRNPRGLVVREDEEDLELHQFEDEQEEPEALRFEDSQNNAEFMDVKEDPEEADPQKIEEDKVKSEPQQFQEMLETPEIKEDEEGPEPPQVKVEQEEPEALEFEDGQKNAEFMDVKKDPEEPDPRKIKEDREKPEPQQFEEKLENPEGLKIEEDEGDPEPPQIKGEQKEPEPPLILVPPPFEEDPEGLQIEKNLNDLKHARLVENREEPEPPQLEGGHQELQLLTFLIQSGQQIQQLLSTCETDAFMEPLTSHQPEPESKQLHRRNRPEDQVCSGVTPDTEQTTAEHDGSEPPSFQQERKKLCSGWEEERLTATKSQEHGWFEPEPAMEQLHRQNRPEDQQSFVKLKTFYSFDSEPLQEEPEPPHFQQKELIRSWEEKLLMATSCQEPGSESLYYHNTPEDHHRFIELNSFYSSVTSYQEQYGSEPVQQQQKNPDMEQMGTPTHLAAETQNQDHSSAVSERRSHTNTVKFSKCYVCSAVVKSQSLNQHLKMHPGVKPYVCKRCGERFAQCARLRDHMMTHLVEELKARQLAGIKSKQKNFFCEICKRGFADLPFLKSHYKAHKWEQPFCETCGKHFTSEHSLKSHLKIHKRKRPKPFYCGLCKKRFACHSSKKSHMKRHKEQEPISYKTWREMSNTTKPVVKHKETPSAPETLFCRICKRLFVYRTSYIFHMKSHKSPANTCRKCGKSFKDKQKLAVHKKSHKKKTALTCSKCGGGFHDKREVDAHVKTCGKLYGCEECGKRFSSWRGVRCHQKSGYCQGKVKSKK